MRVEFIAFTEKGFQQAQRLASCLPGDAQADITRGFGEGKEPLSAWAERGFADADALVLVGAAGIAVRAIAPYAESKAKDPAVIVADEAGNWVIPLLSGHIGGANRLARTLAAGTGAQAVLTTATDVRGVWAVDDWATARGMAIPNPARIKAVSSRLLAGGRVSLASDLPLAGPVPDGVDAVALPLSPGSSSAEEGADRSGDASTDGGRLASFDVLVSPFDRPCPQSALRIVPRRAIVGVGCRRGASEEALAHAVDEALARAGILPLAVAEARSIDLKRDERGLIAFAERRGWPLRFFSADELSAVPGKFAPSEFVERTTGVDNVCERAASACGETVLVHKTVVDGVTVAVALDVSPILWNED